MKEKRGIIFISHVIRLAMPLQILFEAFKDNDEDNTGGVHDENGIDIAIGTMEETPSQDLFSESKDRKDCKKYVMLLQFWLHIPLLTLACSTVVSLKSLTPHCTGYVFYVFMS